jgi:hypothetical protein
MNTVRSAAALLGVAALALPAAAAAKGRPDHTTKAHGHHAHSVMYVFRGTWSGGAVQVSGGNNHVRRAGLVGESAEFDLSAARVVVRDVNADGAHDLSDVQDGDRVVVHARLPQGDPGDAPFAARKLVDRASASSDDAQDEPSGSDDAQPEQD